MLKLRRSQLPATLNWLAKVVRVFRLEPEYLERARAGLTRVKWVVAARVHQGRQLNLWLAVQVQASLKQARPAGLMAALKRLLLRGRRPQQARRRQQRLRQRSWRPSCWRCWTPCAARPLPHRHSLVR